MGGGVSVVSPIEILDCISRWDASRLKSLTKKPAVKKIINKSITRNVQLPGHQPIQGFLTPLCFAVVMDCVEAVKLLLSQPSVLPNVGSDAGKTDEVAVKYLQRSNRCPHCSGQVVYTPLTLAIALHRKICTELLLGSPGVDINAGCPKPLAMAAISGNVEAAAALVRRGVGDHSYWGISPLRLAVEAQNCSMVELLVNVCPDNESLVSAARHSSIQIAECLLRNQSIDINATPKMICMATSDAEGVPWSPLSSAINALKPIAKRENMCKPCLCGRTARLPCANLLLESVDKQLCMCSDLPNPPVVKTTSMMELLLKDTRIDPNTEDNPLAVAVQSSSIRALKRLLQHPGINRQQFTIACSEALKLRERESTEILTALLSHPNCELNVDIEEKSVLLQAARQHKVAALKCLLLKHGLDVNMLVKEHPPHHYRPSSSEVEVKITALYGAVSSVEGSEEDRVQSVKVILSQQGVDPNRGLQASDGYYITPLIASLEAQQWKIAALLLAHPKIDVNLSEPFSKQMSESRGRSPLCFCLENWRTDLIDKILQNSKVKLDQCAYVNSEVLSAIEFSVLSVKSAWVEKVLPVSAITASLLQKLRTIVDDMLTVEHRGQIPSEKRHRAAELVAIGDFIFSDPRFQKNSHVELISLFQQLKTFANPRQQHASVSVPKTIEKETVLNADLDARKLSPNGGFDLARPTTAGTESKTRGNPKPRLTMLLAPSV